MTETETKQHETVQITAKTFNDTQYFAQGTYKRDFVSLLSTSVLANFVSKTVLAPLQRWRIIKQTQSNYLLRPNKFTNFFNFVSKSSKEQGWRSFWRGNKANCWLHFWQIFGQIFIFDTVRSVFHRYSSSLEGNSFIKFLSQRVFAPIFASASILVLTHPIDTARIRITMNYFRNPQEILFNNISSCWSFIRMQERGMKAIFRGYFIANLIALLHINIYSSFRDKWNEMKIGSDNSLVNMLLSKQLIGYLVSLLLLHPLDTIKKNLQLNNQSKPVIFKTTRDVLSYYHKNHNLFKLYEGMTITLLRQCLYVPIFFISLSYLEQNTQLF